MNLPEAEQAAREAVEVGCAVTDRTLAVLLAEYDRRADELAGLRVAFRLARMVLCHAETTLRSRTRGDT